MQKIITSLSFTAILATGLMANGELTGDTKLACEAILCLSSGNPPHECQPSLRKYFSISAKKWSDTVRKRKNFLKLCPANQTAQADRNYDSLIETLSYVNGGCDANTLNANLQSTRKHIGYQDTDDGIKPVYAKFVRINPNKPSYCVALQSHEYGVNHQTVKYTCNSKFYLATDWQRGYELKEVSKDDFIKLPANLSEKQTNPDYIKCNQYERSRQVRSCRERTPQFLYFEKIAISKKCWIDVD